MRAWSAGTKPSSKDAALVTALLTQEPRITLRALVHDGCFGKTAGKAQVELVGRSLTEAEATLAAAV
jgi:phage baseplate assembly protein W